VGPRRPGGLPTRSCRSARPAGGTTCPVRGVNGRPSTRAARTGVRRSLRPGTRALRARGARTRTPRFATRTPRFATRRPRFATRRPRFATRRPRLATRRPRLATRRPRLATRGARLATRRARFAAAARRAVVDLVSTRRRDVPGPPRAAALGVLGCRRCCAAKLAGTCRPPPGRFNRFGRVRAPTLPRGGGLDHGSGTRRWTTSGVWFLARRRSRALRAIISRLHLTVVRRFAPEWLRPAAARTRRLATGRGRIASGRGRLASRGDIGDVNQPQFGHRPKRH
jgi:hypothetical protein